MELDEHEDHEEEDEEEEEEEEEMGFQVSPAAGYGSLGNSAVRAKMSGAGVAEGGAATTPAGRKGATRTVRYRECQKNHAVSIGGHAVDGCCEFMAAGEEGTLEAVICAACNCHRNFHRKEIDDEITSYHQQPRPQPQPPLHPQYHHQFSPYYHRSAPPGYLHHHLVTPPVSQHRPLALPPATSGGGFSREEDDMSNPSSSGGGGGGGGSASGKKKRFRTKFTPEQKDKMLAFAERLGWRIQKHDEAAVEEFCAENCVKRNVLKVWMHNNKHTLARKGSNSEVGEQHEGQGTTTTSTGLQ